jgi:hypothetical protein
LKRIIKVAGFILLASGFVQVEGKTLILVSHCDIVMYRMDTSIRLLALMSLGFVMLGCSDPGNTPTVYERIVIDTYSPDMSATCDTYIDLFDVNGDPDADDPWTGDDTVDAIAFDDSSNTDWPGTYSRIDYAGGLVSGTYYIRVRGAEVTVDDFYVIRVLSLKMGDPLPGYDYPGSFSASPDNEESDDSPQSGGVPTNPVIIELGNTNRVNRSIDFDGSGDVDWFELLLP